MHVGSINAKGFKPENINDQSKMYRMRILLFRELLNLLKTLSSGGNGNGGGNGAIIEKCS